MRLLFLRPSAFVDVVIACARDCVFVAPSSPEPGRYHAARKTEFSVPRLGAHRASFVGDREPVDRSRVARLPPSFGAPEQGGEMHSKPLGALRSVEKLPIYLVLLVFRWLCNRSLWIPTRRDTFSDSVSAYAGFIGPIGGGHRLTESRYADSYSCVSVLFRSRGPSAVLGRVVAVVVDAIKRTSRRARTHVCKEVLEGLPSVADSNASPSVSTKPRVRDSVASRPHGFPRGLLSLERLRPCSAKVGGIFAPTRAAQRTGLPEPPIELFDRLFDAASVALLRLGYAVASHFRSVLCGRVIGEGRPGGDTLGRSAFSIPRSCPFVVGILPAGAR